MSAYTVSHPKTQISKRALVKENLGDSAKFFVTF